MLRNIPRVLRAGLVMSARKELDDVISRGCGFNTDACRFLGLSLCDVAFTASFATVGCSGVSLGGSFCSSLLSLGTLVVVGGAGTISSLGREDDDSEGNSGVESARESCVLEEDCAFDCNAEGPDDSCDACAGDGDDD